MASKIAIINYALARLGAERISSVEEDNKLARMADATYDVALSGLLSKYNWSFAKRVVQLQEVANETHPLWAKIYAKPSDCERPIQLLPPTKRVAWDMAGDRIYCNFAPAYLEYIIKNPQTERFPGYFVIAIGTQIAADMAFPIVQDVKIANELERLAMLRIDEAMDIDSNVGNIYKHPDLDAKYDTFNNPDINSSLLAWDEANGGS